MRIVAIALALLVAGCADPNESRVKGTADSFSLPDGGSNRTVREGGLEPGPAAVVSASYAEGSNATALALATARLAEGSGWIVRDPWSLPDGAAAGFEVDRPNVAASCAAAREPGRVLLECTFGR